MFLHLVKESNYSTLFANKKAIVFCIADRNSFYTETNHLCLARLCLILANLLPMLQAATKALLLHDSVFLSLSLSLSHTHTHTNTLLFACCIVLSKIKFFLSIHTHLICLFRACECDCVQVLGQHTITNLLSLNVCIVFTVYFLECECLY